jgi:DNA mismatch repair protein MLH3
MSIQRLPTDVIAQIKSSTAITSLNDVISELLKNSLDASSTKVDISVDYDRGGCVVEDDGLGVLPSEFCENGGLGKLYRGYIEVTNEQC